MKFSSTFLSLLLVVAASWAVQGFVTPAIGSNTRFNDRVDLEAWSQDDEQEVVISMQDKLKGLAFAGAFAMAMFANPLPSFADGKQTSKDKEGPTTL